MTWIPIAGAVDRQVRQPPVAAVAVGQVPNVFRRSVTGVGGSTVTRFWDGEPGRVCRIPNAVSRAISRSNPFVEHSSGSRQPTAPLSGVLSGTRSPAIQRVVHREQALARNVGSGTEDPLGGTVADDEVAGFLRRTRGGGAALPAEVAAKYSQQLGIALDGVRTHTDEGAHTIARSVQSRAFTHGDDIYFTRGAYAPGTETGQHLLAHELTHVAQYRAGSATGGAEPTIGRVDDPAEREADRVADSIVPALRRSTEKVGSVVHVGRGRGQVRRSADPVIRRKPGKVAEIAEEVDEVREAAVSPVAEPAETLAEFEEFIAAAIDIPVKLTEAKLDAVEHQIAATEAAEGAEKTGETGNTEGADHTPPAGGADSADHDTAEGGGNGHDSVEHLEGVKGDLDETKEHLEAVAHGFEAVAGELLFVSDLDKMAGSLTEIVAAADLLAQGDSLSKNLGAQMMESGVTGVLSGGTGGVVHGVAMVSKHVPVVGTIHSVKEGIVSAKGAIEDATAAEKLRRQTRKVKHLLDHKMPMQIRKQRFNDFVADYQKYKQQIRDGDIIGQAKSMLGAKAGEFDRFERTAGAFKWANPKSPDPQTDGAPFLAFLAEHGIKDFGKGTGYREQVERNFKNSRDAGHALTPEQEEYQHARNLKKVTEFGHRRKAETATVQAVGAVGNLAYAAGDYTAAGDMGATKATGTALKALKAGYTASKKLVKRARRIHKLRTAKNAIGYGGKSARGGLWGATQFFAGNVEKQMGHAKASIASGGSAGGHGEQSHKASTAVPTDGRARAELIRKLTLQCERRAADLIACLKADDVKVRYRAKRIVHVIAETNLAGAIQKVADTDLDKFYELHLLSQGKNAAGVKVASPVGKSAQAKVAQQQARDAKELAELESTLTKLVKKQLGGVGG